MFSTKLKQEIKSFLDIQKAQNKTVGFVPTMGALHNGHLELIRQAKTENDVVACSIFVNPTQFNNPNDLENYPRTFDADVEQLESVYCDLLFTPSKDEMYNKSEKPKSFHLNGLDEKMEGAFRPGHFQGVATIVDKLFELFSPTIAYFGEKDFQQLQIIKQLAKENHPTVSVVGCPTVRNENGLALSSRNSLLSESHRQEAAFIYSQMIQFEKAIQTQTVSEACDALIYNFEQHPDFELEYFYLADEETLEKVEKPLTFQHLRCFIAAHLGGVRLIDNMPVRNTNFAAQ